MLLARSTQLSAVLFLTGWISCGGEGRLAAQNVPDGANGRQLLLERVRDVPDHTLLLNDPQVVFSDIRRLFNDLGLSGLLAGAEDMFGWNVPDGALSPGLALYGWNHSAQFHVQSRPELLRFLRAPESAGADQQPFVPGEGFPQPPLMMDIDLAALDGDDLLLVNKAWNDEREEDRVSDWLAQREELLWPRLDSGSQSILLHSGLAVHNQFKNPDARDSQFLDAQLETFGEDLTAAERSWLESVRQTGLASDRQVIGVQYHDRVIEIRGRAQIGDGKSFDGLVRPGSGSEDWRPDLGLEPEQLVLVMALQMNAFPDSAASRTIPRLGLFFGGEGDGFRWLRGNMLKVLTELIGDSWNDLDAGRIALYENDEAEQAGWLALVGIADSRDPAVVLRELQRMSRLTSPEAAADKGSERDQEIARLIGDLTSDDPNVAGRAETRLVLAGRAAIPALKEAVEGWNDHQAETAERLLRRLGDANKADAPKRAVADPGFWTTLNPGLSLETGTGTVAGFPSHTIEVTPDPTKGREEVAEAVRLMEQLFGPRWNSIQVVQAGRHFVFMVGSDMDLLERTASRVAEGRCELGKDLTEVGHCTRSGQVQVWLHGYRLARIVNPDVERFGRNNLRNFDAARKFLQPAWLAVDLNGTGAEVKALVPVEHLYPVLWLMRF